MLWWFSQSTMVAGGLAALAALACRSGRLGPEARHALWLVVLLKFAIPPVLAWPWRVPDAWPAPAPSASAPALPATALMPEAGAPDLPGSPPAEPVGLPPDLEIPAGPAPLSGVPEVAPDPPSGLRSSPIADAGSGDRGEAGASPNQTLKSPSPGSVASRLLLGLWLAGSVAVASRRAVAVVRFRRSLASSSPAPAWLVEEARAIGERVGVRPPPIRVVPGAGSPLLWCLGRPALILPAALVGRLDAGRWPGILAHELAHLARRDHWVARVELVLGVVWWWNPVFRLARRRVREEAEPACDARVVRAIPGGRLAYAEALVEVCAQLSRSPGPIPALGVGGAGASRSLEGRLTMILRDPIPRRPGRRSALAAGLLAALAMPAWGLGQQPDPPRADPPSKPEAPAGLGTQPLDLPKAGPPSKPEALAIPGPQDPPPGLEATIEAVRAGYARRRSDLRDLGFRSIVAERDQSRRAGRTGGAIGQQRVVIGRKREVRVVVADVLLASGRGSRVDLIEAGPGPIALPRPGEAFAPPAWERRLVVWDPSRILTIGTEKDRRGPVPFRLISPAGKPAPADSLAAMIELGVVAMEADRAIEPLNPRPTSVLDLDGATYWLLSADQAHAEVAGGGTIDGHEVVRVAWIASRDPGLRGLCWLAPKLGFAVVRSDATKDPGPDGGRPRGRRTWRKHATDFARVGDAWLPRKVAYEESEAAPAPGSEPTSRRELAILLEDYKLAPDLPDDAFRPRLAIQALDDLSGEFTAIPPAVPPGLVDRLERAVRESPFGPPVEERLPDEAVADLAAPRADPDLPPAQARPAGAPRGGMPGRAEPGPALANPPAVGSADRDLGAPPAAIGPKGDGAAAVAPDEEIAIEEMITNRFKKDPEVVELASRLNEAASEVDRVARVSNHPGDPAMRKSQEKLKALKESYDTLWDFKSKSIRGAIASARANLPLLRARREGKAAEVRKAEARRDLARAVVARNNALLRKGPQYVSNEEIIKAAAEARVAEAEVSIREADLAEADIALDWTRGGPGASAGAEPPPAASSPTLSDLRDAVELMEVQLVGKQAELRGVRTKSDRAKARFESIRDPDASPRVSPSERENVREEAEVFRADFEAKESEVREFEVRLKQARRRAEAEEARLPQELARAQAKLDWSAEMAKKGHVTAAQREAARLEHDRLLDQLNARRDRAAAADAPAAPKPDPDEAKPTTLARPELTVKLVAEATRAAGQANEYRLAVGNTGSAPANAVQVSVTLPTQGGRLVALPDRTRFDKISRKIIWAFAQIEPGGKVEVSFVYQTDTPGSYRATAEAAAGDLRASAEVKTEVKPSP